MRYVITKYLFSNNTRVRDADKVWDSDKNLIVIDVYTAAYLVQLLIIYANANRQNILFAVQIFLYIPSKN